MERNSEKRIRMFDKMKMSKRIRTRIMDLVIKHLFSYMERIEAR